MPDFPIVDAHLHVYDPGRLDYPWMREVPLLQGPHLPAEFRAALGGVEVEAAVFVEVDAAPDQKLTEAEFVAGLAREDPLIAGMVVGVELDRGAATQAALDKVTEVAGVRGVRQLIQGHVEEPGWCLRDPFVEAKHLGAE
jgi:L-fuconolactonase